MADLREEVYQQLKDLQTTKEFAQIINDLGDELLSSGRSDSDEIIWEVAREIWQGRGDISEKEVYDEFEKILEGL